MLTYGVTDIQNKPSLIKMMDVAEIIDRRAHATLGYFISSKYESYIRPIINQIDRDEKLAKLHKLKNHQDLEFAELGVDDGIK
jgi:lipopolysaccharide biosynthesis protein